MNPPEKKGKHDNNNKTKTYHGFAWPQSGVDLFVHPEYGICASSFRGHVSNGLRSSFSSQPFVGCKKLCALQPPTKNEQNQRTKQPKHMPRTVKSWRPFETRTKNEYPQIKRQAMLLLLRAGSLFVFFKPRNHVPQVWLWLGGT